MGDTADSNPGARLLRNLFLATLSSVIGLVVLLFVIPFLVPQSVEKKIVEKGLSRLFGHAVQVVGQTSIQILPALNVQAQNLVVMGASAAEGMQTVLADIEALELEIGVAALLATEIDIRKLLIQAPQVRFLRDGAGRGNWQPATTDSVALQKPDLDWGWWQDLRIGDVQLSDGRFVYTDPVRGQKIVGERFHLKAFLSDATGAGNGISVSGSARVNSEAVEVRIDIGAVGKLLAGGRLPVYGKLASAYGEIEYQGALAKRQYLVSDGRFSIEVPDIPRLENWLGPVFDQPVDGKLAISGRLNENGSRLGISDLRFAAGRSHATGKIVLTNESKGRRLDADLDLPDFDLRPLVSVVLAPARMDVYQGNIKARWQRLSYGPVVSGPGEVSFSLKPSPRRIEVRVPATDIFGGQGRADVQLAMGEGMTSFRGNLEFNRINTQTLLENLGALGTISGAGDLRLNLFSVGGSFSELLAALRGNGEFNLLAGQVHDEVLAEYLLRGSPGSLPFTQMIGSFRIHQGIVEGNDLLLKAPQLSLVGDGMVDLARNVVDVRLQSLSTDSSTPDGSKKTVRPFRINGSLSNLKIYPEDS